ncbi:hypothetical protein [Halosimplex carlsbadense]|nr:hypothetical protein [Halosimplex carlsbadense]
MAYTLQIGREDSEIIREPLYRKSIDDRERIDRDGFTHRECF